MIKMGAERRSFFLHVRNVFVNIKPAFLHYTIKERFFMTRIASNVTQLLKAVPPHVTVLAAAKTQSASMVMEAYQAGLRHFGHNYVQEAFQMLPAVNAEIEWHMIGHLQRNKVKQALDLFSFIDSLDSLRLADELEKQALVMKIIVPVMIEVNIGEEEAKTGVAPDVALQLARSVSSLTHLQLVGIMTMGPRFGDSEDSRVYFKRTRAIFAAIQAMQLPNVALKYLSMGMSSDYLVAIEEGANMIRLGTAIFGER